MKKIINLFVLLLIIAGISSCVEEDPFFDPDDVENVIEFKSAGNIQTNVTTAPYALFINSYPQLSPESDMDIVVSYSGADVASTDITVYIGVGTSEMLEAFNEVRETNYEIIPSSMYTLPASVTIPQGQRTATYTVKVKPNQFDLTKSYALPLTITSASSGIVSGNFGSAIFAVSAKNQWDGIYTSVAGNVQRYSAPGVPTTDNLNGSMAGNPDVTLSTINANTVEITNLRWAGGSSTIAGIDNLRATIDPATNQVTMTALGNASLRNIAGAENKYDPDTKTFMLNFEWNPTAAARQITGLVLKYESER